MMQIVNSVRVADKLKECHHAMKFLYGEEFHAKIEKYTTIIQKVMKDSKLDVLPAILWLSGTQTWKEINEYSQILFFAAAVKLIEKEKTA